MKHAAWGCLLDFSRRGAAQSQTLTPGEVRDKIANWLEENIRYDKTFTHAEMVGLVRSLEYSSPRQMGV
jgi:hypothetical protein